MKTKAWKRKKCWLCKRTREKRFFRFHNSLLSTHDVRWPDAYVYVHLRLRIEPQTPDKKHICVDCLIGLQQKMVRVLK